LNKQKTLHEAKRRVFSLKNAPERVVAMIVEEDATIAPHQAK
jgi:hypothetical protein